jgi:hypothetical protein
VARKQAERQAALEDLFTKSTTIELAFIMDKTGSMQGWIDAVSEQYISIATDVKRRFGTRANVRMAFVGYSDFDVSEYNRTVKLDFTRDLEAFRGYVKGICADGGGDACEDVFSGLEEAGRLSWLPTNSSTKVVFHVADAPCHGGRFHDRARDSGYDEYYAGVCAWLWLGLRLCVMPAGSTRSAAGD